LKIDHLSLTHENNSMRLLHDKESLTSNRTPIRGNMNIVNNERSQKISPQRYTIKQPKYFKHIDMPASMPSHQTSLQPW
jgi:hypothetical protein